MELLNHTGFDHLLFRSSLDEDTTVVSIAVRVVFRQHGKQIAIVPPTDDLLLTPAPVLTRYGPVESDLIFRRGGTDIYVYGHAYAPQPGVSRESIVSVYYNGQQRAALKVFGTRRWEGRGKNLRPGFPAPFERVALSLGNAFGGKALWDGLEVPCGSNMFGKGYYLEAEEAQQGELPQLEFAEHQINNWQQQPDPAGLGQFPMACSFRFQRGTEWDDEGRMKALRPEYGNVAAPGMIVPFAKAGDHIRVTGASPAGDFSIEVPPLGMQAILSFGEQKSEAELYLDQIGLIPDEQTFFITYRYHFAYKVREMEKRLLEIKMNGQ
ncbi:MAG: DUF2169 domain-containing protein [Bacteroidota bacterium]